MLKIVHFGKYYFPDIGGIESVTCSLARGAAVAGHQVTVVCFVKSPPKNEEVIDGVKVIRAPVAKLIASQPLGFKYVRFCLKAAQDADIIHLHFPNMVAAFCSLFLSKKTRLLVHWHSDVINKGFLGKFLRPLEHALLKRADCIIATSQAYIDASPSLRAFQHKITVVPIGAPDILKLAAKDSEPGDLPQDLSARLAGKKLILSVGRLVPYKGFDVLIEAAKYLDDNALIVIVGNGPLQDFLKNAISTANVGHRVYMAGRLSRNTLHMLFARASIFCLPSTYRAEAFGVVLLEAMAYRLPIIATNIPGSGVPWVNQDGVSGINVPVCDARKLAQTCNDILNDEDRRVKLSNGARNRFISEFTEEVALKRMIETYNHLVLR